MKLGFDGKRATQNFTGLGNYSRYIVDILCRYYPEEEYILYAPKKRSNKMLTKLLNQYHNLKVIFPKQTGWKHFSSLWRIWGISKQIQKDNISLFHGLSNELPFNIRSAASTKSVVTIHDLIFLLFPQYYPVIDRKIYACKFRKACMNADRIIAISECTKRDIIRFFHIPEEKIEIIYQGCDASFLEAAPDNVKKQVRKEYSLPERYILNVGSIEERKNVLLVVQALPQLPENIHLVIVGKRTSYTDKIEQYAKEKGLTHRLHILNRVPFELLPALYQLAEIFVYPSRYEGFGIPIIEALHSHIPVVAATGSCLEEAGGPDSVYVHPDNVHETAKVLNHLITHPEARERMISQGNEYVKRFSEERQAQALFKLYKSLVEKP